jgi:tetratricopeptide (TPR) repeat protein
LKRLSAFVSDMSFSLPLSTAPARRRAGTLRVGALSALLACSVPGVLAPRPALAQTAASEAERALELNEAGSALYAAGDITGALRAFEQAYALVAEPNLLFNIAGCHERLGQRTQALEYYRWYLGSNNANPEGRRRAIAGLSRLEAKPPETPPPPAVEAEASSTMVWSLATLGAGIVFAGLGAALYLDGAHDHNEVTGAPGYGEITGSSSLTEVEAQELIDSGDTKKLLGAVGIGIGGALITTHVVISLWQASESDTNRSSAELRLLPNGWAVSGTF